MIDAHVAEITKAQARQAQEQKELQVKQAQEERQAMAKVEAALLQRIDQLSQEVKHLTHRHTLEVKDLKNKHESAMKDLRHKLDEVVQKQASTVKRVNRVDEKFSGLMDDIDRQAQAHLQAELSSQASLPSGSGQSLPSSHFAPTSNAR